MKKLINDHRKKTRGCPASNVTFTADVSFPLSGRHVSDGGLFVLDKSCLAILNQSLLYIKALHCQTSEKSKHSALRTQFPNAVIKGCLFHWKQCLLRRFRKLHGYADNELMKTNLHVVYGLAFVPVGDVSIGWTCLKS